jgi:ubiquitin carboxyl-terminal hydrolase 5/13
LGIDIKGTNKTEKTVTELNLEANLALTLSKVLEKGQVLTPVFGPLNTGMQNLGNTCYLNSVVQMVMSLPEYREKYLAMAEEY